MEFQRTKAANLFRTSESPSLDMKSFALHTLTEWRTYDRRKKRRATVNTGRFVVESVIIWNVYYINRLNG